MKLFLQCQKDSNGVCFLANDRFISDDQLSYFSIAGDSLTILDNGLLR